jgi:iron complex transport system substrate-binding protein
LKPTRFSKLKSLAAVFLMAPLAAACVSQASSNKSPAADDEILVREPPVTNITDGRVATYDPQVHYFPDKVSIESASQLRVAYHKNYKVLTIIPRVNPDDRFDYVLVQRGTPAPQGYPAARVIEVPVKRFMMLHSGFGLAVERLNLNDRLIAVAGFKDVTVPGMRQMIEAGKIKEVGGPGHMDVERVIQLNPDLVMTYWSVSPEYSDHPKMDEVGIKTAALATHWETTPLGAAEWIKAVAMFFNREKEAQRLYDGMAQRYQELAARVRDVPYRPRVISGFPSRGRWRAMGPRNPALKLIEDAGGEYFIRREERIGDYGQNMGFESVFRRHLDTDIWLDAPVGLKSIDDLLARDRRVSFFKPFQKGEVYTRRMNEKGQYFNYDQEDFMPDVQLADMIKILHPAKAPEHQLVFLRRLEPPKKPVAVE